MMKELRSFLSLCHIHSRLMAAYTWLAAPLTYLMKSTLVLRSAI